MATGPITEEPKLLFLDTVFHLSSSTVKFVIKPLGATFEIGQHITRIGSSFALFSFGNNPPFLVPSLGLVLEL